MRYRMPILAAGALTAALAIGSSAPTKADPLPRLDDFFVIDATPTTVTLIADASPEAQGVEAMILFGELPFQGMPVAGATLLPGPNLIQAPNMGPGWFTAVGAFKARTTTFSELPDEQ